MDYLLPIGLVCMLLLFGWRAWSILRDAHPLVRSLGTVFSVFAPIPVFLVVIVYHYAAKKSPRGAVLETGAHQRGHHG